MGDYTKDTLWTTYDGIKIPIKGLENNHILNIYSHLKKRIKTLKKEVDTVEYYYLKLFYKKKIIDVKKLLSVINQEISSRKLDKRKVYRGRTIPFKKDGRWMTWKEGEPQPTPVPNSIDFIKPIKN